jgi:hypothetical protein
MVLRPRTPSSLCLIVRNEAPSASIKNQFGAKHISGWQRTRLRNRGQFVSLGSVEGKAKSETCVIELCSLPAKGSKEGVKLRDHNFSSELVEQILQERIALIRRRILDNCPKFAVMYGMIGKPYFERLAGRELRARRSCHGRQHEDHAHPTPGDSRCWQR